MSDQLRQENEQLLKELRWLWDLMAVKFSPSNYCLNLEEKRRLKAIGKLTGRQDPKGGVVADLIVALEFYAERENWKDIETGIGMYPGDAIDNGATARAALNKLKP